MPGKVKNNVSFQRRLAAEVLGVGVNRIWIDPSKENEIKQAMTKDDIRMFIQEGAIKVRPFEGVSRVRAREREKKDKRRGPGSKKGKKTSLYPKKKAWMDKIRAIRFYLRLLKERGVLNKSLYRDLYRKASGGMFNSKKAVLMYLEMNRILEKDKLEKAKELLKESKELRKKILG
ncbi:MAG TPA: 50S ribosomal protein L19e [Nautiliaceae bacterium]|nr:50S ribosomal protein L19e [Nautiliaceae bacterium]